MKPGKAIGVRLPPLGLAVIVILAVGLTGLLGIWQLRRLNWKTDLQARLLRHWNAPIADLPSRAEWEGVAWDADRPDRWIGRRVQVSGHFVNGDSLFQFVGASPRGQGIYRVITPLQVPGWGTVIVSRGTITTPSPSLPPTPTSLRPASNAGVRPMTRITARVLPPDPAPATLAGPSLSAVGKQRVVTAIRPDFWRHPQRERPLAPFLLWRIPEGEPLNPPTTPGHKRERPDSPIAEPSPPLRLSNNHLEYALTWFGLATAMALSYGAYLRTRFRTGS